MNAIKTFKYAFWVVSAIFTLKTSAQKPFLIPFIENGKWGLMDSSKRTVVQPIYDDINPDYYYRGWSLKKERIDTGNPNHVIGSKDFWVIDSTGKLVMDSPYESIPYFTPNHAIVNKGSKQIILSRTGKEIPLNVDDAKSFKNGLTLVRRANQFGFIDTNGVEIIPIVHDGALSFFQKDVVALQQNGLWGLFTNKGKEIVYFIYDEMDDYACIPSRIKVRDNNRGWGFINPNGEEVIPPQYSYVSPMNEGFAYFSEEGRIGFIDSMGKVIVKPQYIYAGFFQEGRATVGNETHQGIIDTQGNVLLWTKRYSDIEYFKDGLAVVSDEKEGFIDLSGKEVIPMKYDEAEDFSEGLARVKLKNKVGFIDKKGKTVIPIKYDEAEDFFNGLAKVKLKGLAFYIDRNGKAYIK